MPSNCLPFAVFISSEPDVCCADCLDGFLVSTYALSTAKPPVTIRGVVSLYGTTDLVRQLKLGRRRNPNAFNYLGSADFAIRYVVNDACYFA